MVVLREAGEEVVFDRAGEEIEITWEQMLALFKGKKKFSLSAATAHLKGWGMTFEINPARLKFFPGGVQCKGSGMTCSLFRRGALSIWARKGAYLNGTYGDETIYVRIVYEIGKVMERAVIVGA